MIYIASPYTHPSAQIRNERCKIAEAFAAEYAKRERDVYCPIASWHHIAVTHKLPTSAAFWHRLNTKFLRLASEVWVLMIDGWDESEGVALEIAQASRLYIPIRYFNADNFAEEAVQPYTFGEV